VVAIAANPNKAPMFPLEARVDMARRVLPTSPMSMWWLFGTHVIFARDNNLSVVVRGLRAVSDFEFEFQLANMSGTWRARSRLFPHSTGAVHLHLINTGAGDRRAGWRRRGFVHPLVEAELKKQRRV